ncbi:MAG TPA: hypothetical protein VGI40_25110, partial [Pirellulaceae bacterium]|jgi:hypothetical protein
LAEWTGGEIKFASMPPLAGDLTPISRILLKPTAIESGDLFWCLAANRCDGELAFFRGAIGVVCTDRTANPWPGRFVLLVTDPVAALQSLVEGLARQLSLPAEEELGREKFALESPELKVLQLCAAPRADNSPPVQSRCRSTISKCRTAA